MTTDARCLGMLRYIGGCGEVPLHVLMQAFWPGEDGPLAERRVKDWVRRQCEAGNLRVSRPRRMDTSVRLSPRMSGVLAPPQTPNVGHPRAWAHHAATLRYVEQVRSELKPNEVIAQTLLEPQLRAQIQAGRGTRRGQTYDSFPDAVLVIHETTPDGVIRPRRVAVEYVTSKYTTKDIQGKCASFACTYDQVMWVADNRRTQARVERIVGGICACLNQ